MAKFELWVKMKIFLKEEKDIVDLLRYFNYFHDSFMKSITLSSHDYVEVNKSKICTNLWDVCIKFAHYNYREGAPPHNQIVRSKFKKVSDFCFNLKSDSMSELSILEIDIRAHDGKAGQWFDLNIKFEFYDESIKKWEELNQKLFSFREAEFSD